MWIISFVGAVPARVIGYRKEEALQYKLGNRVGLDKESKIFVSNSLLNEMDIIYLVDISGKVDRYDRALYKALHDVDERVRLLVPTSGLLSLVPNKFRDNDILIKRLVKALEGLCNYMYLMLLLAIKHPIVLHLQWLPFMEVCGWEILFLKCMKRLSPCTKLILTIHNLYPHNMSEESKVGYNDRFRTACSYIDGFIVHTETSKKDVCTEFGIEESRIRVCCHGVFVPEKMIHEKKNRENGIFHILQFGGHSHYKGTDLLVDAVCGMEQSAWEKMEVRIVGRIKDSFLSELKEKDKSNFIIWKPYFLDDLALYEEIANSDLIVLPYRMISQSGVLLLSIYFGKLIICSDLPSFKETMRGDAGDSLDDVLFFRTEDAESLRSLIAKYINNVVDVHPIYERIAYLKDLYSWESAAKATKRFYEM